MQDLNDDVIRESYLNHQSTRKVAKELGISVYKVNKRLKELGILNKLVRYKCNEDFFKHDSPEVFYWAGFIAADGCVKLHGKRCKQLSIALAIKDHEHLVKFKKAVNYNGPISLKNHSTASEIVISSAIIFDDLERFNIVPRKTKIYKFPEWILEHQYLNHFMRGYFDGDGSFYSHVSKNRKVRQLFFDLRGTKEFLTTYKIILENKCGVRKSNNKPRFSCGIYSLGYGGTRAVSRIRDFLYKDSTSSLRLDRKFKFSHNEDFVNIPQDYKFKPVIGKNIKTGEIFRFKSMKDAADELNLIRTSISDCCRKKCHTHKGYTWEYDRGVF